MADPTVEARIRDLKRRVDLEPGSRLFVALAEEYRKAGRHAEALSALQKGLLAHPNYLSAPVALGRAYLEAGQITEAISTFSKVLSNDPGNLVSAKWLADIYLSRGDSVEAIKKYKLYRALSGDRTVDDIVEQLEVELAPPPPPSSVVSALPPPPTFFDSRPMGPVRKTRDTKYDEPIRRAPSVDLDETSVKFEPDESHPRGESVKQNGAAAIQPSITVRLPLPTPPLEAPQPLRLDPAAPVAEPRREPPVEAPFETGGPSAGREADSENDEEERTTAGAQPPAGPQGRILADLYFAQGHFAEALSIYDDLVGSNPHDEDLRRLRRDAEARLLPAATRASPGSATGDPALERRLAKVRALKQWLSVVQTG